MTLRVRALSLPKAGHRVAENEDAWAQATSAAGMLRVAVSDGATESAFSGAWARSLVQAWADGGEAAMETVVQAARAAFERATAGGLAGAAWFVAAKAEEGAHAAFLGVEVAPGGAWRAAAVGDCVLFHLRGGALLRAWPMDDPAAFGNRPALLTSRADRAAPPVEAATGRLEPGDRLLLATDALAAHLLATDPPAALGLDADGFAAFVVAARAAGMHNDDVTLVEVAAG